MNIVIGARHGDHVNNYLRNLISYLSAKRNNVAVVVGAVGPAVLAKAAVVADLVILWNGEGKHYRQARECCAVMGIPVYIAEVGYFPQSDYYTLDSKGINASSELMNDDLSEVEPAESLLALARRRLLTKYELLDFQPKVVDRLFVPLQLPTDTNIKLHSDFNDMQKFIRYVEEKAETNETDVIFKRHPRDLRKYDSKWPIDTKTPSIKLILESREVYGINSTVLLEALLFDKPVTAIGRGFVMQHGHQREKLLTALCRKQIPVATTALDKWLVPILQQAKK